MFNVGNEDCLVAGNGVCDTNIFSSYNEKACLMEPIYKECYKRMKEFTSNTSEEDLVNLYAKWAPTFDKVTIGNMLRNMTKIFHVNINVITYVQKYA